MKNTKALNGILFLKRKASLSIYYCFIEIPKQLIHFTLPPLGLSEGKWDFFYLASNALANILMAKRLDCA